MRRCSLPTHFLPRKVNSDLLVEEAAVERISGDPGGTLYTSRRIAIRRDVCIPTGAADRGMFLKIPKSSILINIGKTDILEIIRQF